MGTHRRGDERTLLAGLAITVLAGLGACALPVAYEGAMSFWSRLHGGGCSCRCLCVVNLRAIEGAKLNWALENRKTTNDVPTDADLFGEDRYIREKPQCPENGIYGLGRVSEKPTCSVRAHTY